MDQNTTSPEARVGWVSTGNGRGTADILWSCFSILLVCTWNCFHSNVPSVEESEAGWLKWHRIPYWPERPLLNKWTRKLVCIAGIIIAPEFGVALATAEYLSAKINITDTEHLELEAVQGEPSSEKNVGITSSESTTIKNDVDIPDDKVKPQQLTICHAFCANMGGFKVKIYEGGDSKRFYKGIIRKYQELQYLRKVAIEIEIPSEEDVKGLGSSDVFSKAFACVQSAWLVIQCIARASAGLPITQLELATIAFVTCGILMYLLWWNKPFGLERRGLIIATVPNHAQSSIFESLTGKLKYIHLCTDVGLSNEGVTLSNLLHYRVKQRIFFDEVADPRRNDLMAIIKMIYRAFNPLLSIPTKKVYPSVSGGMVISLLLSGTIFSALHIAAWNFSFPSVPIQIAWRTFAITATSANLIPILFMCINSFYELNEAVNGVILMIISILYCLSRLGLLVLIFLCFSSMPAGVYQTVKWTKFLPHFS